MKTNHLYCLKFAFKHHVFWKTFTLLTLISALPLLCVSLIFANLSERFWKSETYSSNQRALTQYMNDVDNQVMATEEDGFMLATNASVLSFILKPTFTEISRNTLIMKSLQDIMQSDNGIHYAYLYSNFSGLVLSSEHKGYYYNNFYDKSALDLYKNGTYNPVVLRSGPTTIPELENCISFYQNIPVGSKGDLGCLILNMDRDFLFQSKAADPSLQMTVYDENGVCLYSHSQEISLLINQEEFQNTLALGKENFIFPFKPDDFVVFQIKSPSTGWTYIGISPLPVFFSNYHSLASLFLILAAVALFFSFILSFAAAKRLYLPLKGLISSLKLYDHDNVTEDDEYQYVHKAFHSVIEKNQTMTNIVNRLRPDIKNSLFLSLLLSEPLSSEELQAKLSFIAEGFSSSWYGVVLFVLENYHQFIQEFSEDMQALYNCRLADLVTETAQEVPHAFFRVNRFSWALSINISSGNQETFSALAAKIKQSVAGLPFPLSVSSGNLYEDPFDLPYSYREAQEAIKYLKYQDDTIPSTNRAEVPEYYLNGKLEAALLQTVRAGTPGSVSLICMEIYQNMRSHAATIGDVSITATHIVDQVVEVLISLGIDISSHPEVNLFYYSLKKCQSVGDIQILLQNTVQYGAQCVEALNSKQSGKNIEKMKEYINSHLGEDISLQDLADLCQVSPSYISRLFKRHLNIGFVDYLNSLRIARAKKLLEETQMTVEQVGFQSGFNNVRSFMRLFKQYENVSPGQYRNRHQKEP